MRCNAGVNPKYLTDSWLMAEQVELLMVNGLLVKMNGKIKTTIPKHFKLGAGHMAFWCNKLLYLERRHQAVKQEVAKRGFKVAERCIDAHLFDVSLRNDWEPSQRDTDILRARLKEKLFAKPDIWRYNRDYVRDVSLYWYILKNSELYKV